jgi:hypothetical protein
VDGKALNEAMGIRDSNNDEPDERLVNIRNENMRLLCRAQSFTKCDLVHLSLVAKRSAIQLKNFSNDWL